MDSGKSRPHRDSFPDRPASSESLYRLSYPAHIIIIIIIIIVTIAKATNHTYDADMRVCARAVLLRSFLLHC